MRQIFKVESFEKNGKYLADSYMGDDLESEARKMLTHEIWYYLDNLSIDGKDVLEHNIAYSTYINKEGFVTYSALLSVKYMSGK